MTGPQRKLNYVNVKVINFGKIWNILETRGPWATSLTLENSSNQTHMITMYHNAD